MTGTISQAISIFRGSLTPLSTLFTVPREHKAKTTTIPTTLRSMRLENVDRVRQWSLDRNSDSGGRGAYGWERYTSFQHTFRKQGHHIIGSYIFGYGTDDSKAKHIHLQYGQYRRRGVSRRFNDDDSYNRRHSLQIDYATHFSEKSICCLRPVLKATWQRDFQGQVHEYGTTQSDMELRESEKNQK